ncbi:glutaredoxin domain-containing protein [Ramlibacter sp.]|uniref:glutaredoxin domain-containing protein n=1 Tax=Ramlibacter sp. TaxID=1917967 RepID=UPI003D12902F
MTFARPAAALVIGIAAAWSTVADAQQVFRIVGPDGKVTFSDRPPPSTSNAKSTAAPVTAPVTATGAQDATAALPFEVRTVAARYPVVLYSSATCPPCSTARGFLTGRGIPYAERTIVSVEDLEALKRISGAPTLPFLTIGSQQLRGFSEVEWTQFLDAAGYPKTSRLPASYRNPPPAPLVAVQQPPVAPPPSSEVAAPPAPVQAPAGPGPDNPTGIRF